MLYEFIPILIEVGRNVLSNLSFIPFIVEILSIKEDVRINEFAFIVRVYQNIIGLILVLDSEGVVAGFVFI